MTHEIRRVYSRGMDEELLTPEEAAIRLKVEPQTLENWRKTRNAGKGPPYRKLGRAIRYLESELREWVAGREKKGGAA